MAFDVPTAILVTALLTFGVGASLSFAASRYPEHLRTAMRIWIGGLLLETLALLSASIRGPDAAEAFFIVATNTVYALSFAEMGRAMDHFAGRARSRVPLLLVGIVCLILFLFTAVWPSPRWRISLDTIPLVALQLGVARSVLLGRDVLRPADYLTGLLFVGVAVLALLRGVAEFAGPLLPALDFRGEVLSAVLVFGATLPMLATIGFTLMCVDRLNDDLSRLAMVDPLTGVYNRRTLASFAETAIADARRLHLPLALLAIDVDHFKQINDRYGHDAGDEALLGLIQRMRAALADDAMLSRIGGEEFAVLLPVMDEAEALEVAERMRSEVAASPLRIGEHTLALQVSIGIATLADGPGNLHDLLREADRALYAAKHAGRNRCVTRSSLARAQASASLDLASR
jgi:diguanylate cyclase (GGDEF)-like protein